MSPATAAAAASRAAALISGRNKRRTRHHQQLQQQLQTLPPVIRSMTFKDWLQIIYKEAGHRQSIEAIYRNSIKYFYGYFYILFIIVPIWIIYIFYKELL